MAFWKNPDVENDESLKGHSAFSERYFVFREFGPSPHYWLSMGLPLLDIFGPPSAFIKTMLFLLPRDAFKDGRAEELDNKVLVRKGE